MKLPRLRNLSQSQSMVGKFGGYNHTHACGEAECYNGTNLSTRSFPALSPRRQREKIATLANPHGIYAKNDLLWVDGTQLYYDGAAIGAVSDTDKTFCGIGGKVLIWPDKKIFDTVSLTLQDLGAKWVSTGDVTFSLSKEDGGAYTLSHTGTEEPEEPDNGDYWLDTSGDSDALRVYSSASESWSAVPTTYLKIAATGIGNKFARFDTVTMSGLKESVLGDAVSALNADLIIWSCDDDWIVVLGLLDETTTQTLAQGAVTVERKIPDLDFMTECDNRVWGCNSEKHEIYACKLGDPTNWYSYMGTAADAYALTVGSDGDFTGAATCRGSVLFFKETVMHKIYGTKPANFSISTMACRGVQHGCAKSLATVNETLYYKAVDGVMSYAGGTPNLVSGVFGDALYKNAVGGANLGAYYISLQDEKNDWHLFCFDEAKNMWHRQDAVQVNCFARDNIGLCFLKSDGTLWRIDRAGTGDGTLEPLVEWSAEFGEIGLYTPDHKTVSKIELRAELTEGATLCIDAFYAGQGGGSWQQIASYAGHNQKQFILIPIIPRRCEYLKLRCHGIGDITLYTITKTLEQGSELNGRPFGY